APFTLKALLLALLTAGAVGAASGGRPDPDEDRVPLWPADLARAAERAPAPVAALFRALADPDEKATPAYEETALRQIDPSLKEKSDAGARPAAQRLQAAEDALAAVLRYHLGTRDRPLAGAGPWADLEGRLRQKLFDVARQQLRVRAASARGEKDWLDALAL